MKVAFVGKGGSGKTTLSSLFIKYLGAQGLPVLAIDADINQHLGPALGQTDRDIDTAPQMGDHLEEIKDYLRGDNRLISSAKAMVKTTPAGTGSRLLRLNGDDDIQWQLSWPVGDTVRLLSTGAFNEQDLGVACYHSKTGAVELCLNHLLDRRGEYAVVDMTAGADSFATGLCAKFDITFFVMAPTLKDARVYKQYKEYAAHYGIRLRVIGNKVRTADDVDFLRKYVGDDLLTYTGHSEYVRAFDQGVVMPFGTLEDDMVRALAKAQSVVDATPQDWERFQRLAIEFHVRNAEAWGNRSTGMDLAAQVDHGFALSPALLAA